MRESILKYADQFAWKPVIANREKLPAQFSRVILAGMGGSHLAADLVLMWKPELSLLVHEDYGLPYVLEDQRAETFVIASSYSGNTEETLDAFEQALGDGYPCAAIGVGGKLIARAKETGVSYVELPDLKIQPRMALGVAVRGLLALLDENVLFDAAGALAATLDPLEYEDPGRAVAEALHDRVPVIYSSRANRAIAYNWKIKFNETAKIPAFMNVLPELNHNEMNGFDVQDPTRALSEKFIFVFLRDAEDHPRIIKRMDVLAGLYRERGLPVFDVPLEGENQIIKTFASLLTAEWATLALATRYGLEPDAVPMVEEFKKLIA